MKVLIQGAILGFVGATLAQMGYGLSSYQFWVMILILTIVVYKMK